MCFGGFHENVAKTKVLDPYHGGGGQATRDTEAYVHIRTYNRIYIQLDFNVLCKSYLRCFAQGLSTLVQIIDDQRCSRSSFVISHKLQIPSLQ